MLGGGRSSRFPLSPLGMISSPKTSPRYQPGQLIHHKRYAYRGVIVAVDHRCLADDAWYHSNQTQPNQEQPWYHVLVDRSTRTTYVAESNLEEDLSGEPIEHPLLAHFFGELVDGRYIRNDREWRAW